MKPEMKSWIQTFRHIVDSASFNAMGASLALTLIVQQSMSHGEHFWKGALLGVALSIFFHDAVVALRKPS